MKSEFDLYPLWLSFCKGGRKSICGRLQGIDAGELNTSEGPDFKNAFFILDDIRYCGDVEIHLRCEDWYTHGHQNDSRYDQVMLHLVWSAPISERKTIKTSMGRQIPTLSIRNFPPALVPTDQVARCRPAVHNSERFSAKIKKVIRQRLIGQGRMMHTLTCQNGADQVFYEGILRILGSPQNVQNFQWIAQKLNWKMITFLKQSSYLSGMEWYAVYLYLAGLLHSRMEFASLRGLSRRISHLIPAVQLTRPMWKLAGQRPSHNPLQRLAGLAVFIRNFPGSSIFTVFHELCTARTPYPVFKKQMSVLFQLELPSELKKAFSINKQQNMWGNDLMSELIGNVVIPYFFYQAHKNGSSGFQEYLEFIYCSLPHTNRYTCLRNFLSWPEVQSGPKNKFFFTQALLHIRQNYCLNDLCQTCPLDRVAESR